MIRLFFPISVSFPDPQYTVNFPNPEFDNQQELNVSRIYRKSKGFTQHVFRDSIWPRNETFSYSFRGLTNTIISDLNTFLNYGYGNLIKLVDYEEAIYEGFITDLGEITQEFRPTRNTETLSYEDKGYTFNFSFIGEFKGMST